MICVLCSSPTKNPKFCNSSCAAIFNNRAYPKRAKAREGVCKKCSGRVPYKRTYCDECWRGQDTENRVGRWLSGEFRGGSDRALSEAIRRYLLEISEYKCNKCGFSKNHPADGKTILEINHINGDGTDHRVENVEVICPNCHALTLSYRGRNVGKGRPCSYIRKYS